MCREFLSGKCYAENKSKECPLAIIINQQTLDYIIMENK